MKGSSIAHPIQGLIKYHGLKDDVLRIPYHDSISVATSPTNTHTTLEFAALAVAAWSAADMKLSLEQISVIARRGAGSATRSVTGAFSRWRAGFEDEESYSYQIASEDFQMGIVVALIPAFKYTENAHKAVLTSPFFHSRLAFVHGALAEMENAIRKRNVDRIGTLAERDSLILHGITMTSIDEMMLWRPETVKVILEGGKMAAEGLAAYCSIDTGATVYVNTKPKHVKEVEKRIKKLGIEEITCGVG